MSFLNAVYELFIRSGAPSAVTAQPTVDTSLGWEDGDRWAGSFGTTFDTVVDYYTIRTRSDQLFRSNEYAAGLLDRVVTNEVHTGLTPESYPVAEVLGLSDDEAAEFSDSLETRFSLWASTPELCDYYGESTFGQLQAQRELEALIGGDCLVVIRQHPRYKLPTLQIIPADKINTPVSADIAAKHEIHYGIEIDARGRKVAAWSDNERFAFRGRRSGRTTARMYYAGDKRVQDVRGMPLLGVVLQSLRDLSRYKDSATRQAVVNSLIAMWVETPENKLSGRGVSMSAATNTSKTVKDGAGALKVSQFGAMFPGTAIEGLAPGAKLQMNGGNGVDVNFKVFEEAITAAIAWSRGIPPEIYRLAFSSNYSASQAALNEYVLKIALSWSRQGSNFCQPIFEEWVIAESLLGKINLPGFMASLNDATRYDVRAAWVKCQWLGSVKPTTDPAKQIKAARERLELGLDSFATVCRALTGQKFDNVVKRQRRERAILEELPSIGALVGAAPASVGAPSALLAEIEEFTDGVGDSDALISAIEEYCDDVRQAS